MSDKIGLGFGGASLTSMKSYKDALYLLDYAFDQGIQHFDTAPLYGKGYSELIIGSFLKGKRNKVTITTKFGLGDNFELGMLPINILMPTNYYIKKLKSLLPRNEKSFTAPYSPIKYRKIDKILIESSIIKSLNRLKIENIDYYLLHEGLPNFLTESALEALIKLKEKGIINNFGLGSNRTDIVNCHSDELKRYNILQYEGNVIQETIGLLTKYPDKIHFQHSCIKDLSTRSIANIELNEKAGYILAQASSLNEKGKVIFSTREVKTLRDNVKGYLKYQNAFENGTFKDIF